jgi:hypothetical protein
LHARVIEESKTLSLRLPGHALFTRKQIDAWLSQFTEKDEVGVYLVAVEKPSDGDMLQVIERSVGTPDILRFQVRTSPVVGGAPLTFGFAAVADPQLLLDFPHIQNIAVQAVELGEIQGPLTPALFRECLSYVLQRNPHFLPETLNKRS